jgi:hypothetical protein
LCDASEYYEAHKEQCDKLYDNLREKNEDEEVKVINKDDDDNDVDDEYNKENCEDNNGEWIEDECDFFEHQMKEGWEADEDRFYKQVCMDDEESDECKKHRISIED